MNLPEFLRAVDAATAKLTHKIAVSNTQSIRLSV